MTEAGEAPAVFDNANLLLAAIAASSNDVIIGKDLNGTVVFWNDAAERLFGFSADEMIGAPIMQIIPSDRTDEEALILDRIRRGERLSHFETVRLTKDGRAIPVSVTISPIRDADGGIIGASKIARDLSESHRISSALRQREALLQSILDTVPDGLIVIDRHGIIQSFSPAAERMFGFTRDEATGRNIATLMPASYAPISTATWRPASGASSASVGWWWDHARTDRRFRWSCRSEQSRWPARNCLPALPAT
jgi:PAS domain S-box-containing protein